MPIVEVMVGKLSGWLASFSFGVGVGVAGSEASARCVVSWLASCEFGRRQVVGRLSSVAPCREKAWTRLTYRY